MWFITQFIDKWFGDRALGGARSPHWNALRKDYIAGHPLCEVCGKKARDIHHLIPFSVDPSKELLWENLTALCRDCHWSYAHLFSWRSYNNELKEWAKKVKERP